MPHHHAHYHSCTAARFHPPQKSLDNLVEAGHLAKKDFKSSVLYWLDQAQFSDVTPDMVTELMQSIEQLTSAKNETTNTRRGLEQRYSSLSTAMTEAEMDAKIAELEAEMETKNARLAKITGGVAGAGAGSSSSSSSAAAALDPLRKAKAKTILERYRRVWSDRKGAVMDMVEHMAEGLNKVGSGIGIISGKLERRLLTLPHPHIIIPRCCHSQYHLPVLC